MPGTVKKELYLAKSMGQLNEMAELPAKLKTTNPKLLVKTADKMLKEAEHQEILHDEERAYVLFMKYFNVVTFLKKTSDYKKQKSYYDDLVGSKNLVKSLDKAEELSSSLKDRYDLLEAESVAKKLEVLDAKVENDMKKPNTTEDKDGKKDVDPPKVEETMKKQEEGVISCTKLYNLIEDRDAQLIIMDVRSISEYQESRINHKNVINVPAEAIKPGTTVTYIEKALPLDSLSLWKQRGNIDHIILLDWNTTFDRVKVGSTLQTLKDALFKYDSTVIIKSEPLVLDGGYEQWLLHYPTKCLNPDFKKILQTTVIPTQGSLLDFDYPDFEETFMKPAQPAANQNIDGPSEKVGTSLSNGATNGDLSVNGSLPRIDRTTKPKVDRSTKNNLNVTKIEVPTSSLKTGALYPDVKSVGGPITNFGEAGYLGGNSSNAGSRSLSTSTQNEGNQSKNEVLSSELSDLDKLKKQKQEELADIQRKHEEMMKATEARLEKMRLEEERLSDLEQLRKKEQTDVADLMRKKRSLQESMASETLKARSENERTQREEADRKRELDQIETEKRKREEEVIKLRTERKKKAEEADALEREKKERAFKEAQETSRREEERRKKELDDAEERAWQLKLEEDRKEAARQKEELERKRKEKELKERLEREKEDKRKQLEMDQRLQERRAREEAERKQKEENEKKERQERELKERQAKDEEERKKVEEAKRVADEKIRLMNEAARVNPKIVPSPNLQVGWEKKLDSRTMRYFYVNHNDGTTQWEPPSTPGTTTTGSNYTTKLKEEPKETRRGLSRSNSSPNIAQMLEDESKGKKIPSIDRGNKPIKRVEAMPKPRPMPVKRRDLNPVYGNVGRALTGLRNLGNTCYMNSTIQCLNNTSPLVTYLLTDMYLYDINRESPLGNHGEVADELGVVVKALWSGQYRFISPRDFKSVVGKYQPMFAGFDQQDSQEFLTFLLDGLHEGLNKVKTRPKIPEQDNDRLSDYAGAELAWKNHKLQNESIIVELFQGQLKSTIMCLSCRKQSVTFQAFMFLSLPIPSASRCTLQECLRQFSSEEKMTGSSRWKCPQCACYRDSVKKIEIWKVPRILLIALNRFVYEGQWRTKINAFVDFPIRDLNLDSHVKGPPPRPYKLYAVSNHFGSLDGGHYTASCKNPCNQQWYKYDDHEVYEMSESNIKTSAAYVLYYTSIELPPPEFRPSFG